MKDLEKNNPEEDYTSMELSPSLKAVIEEMCRRVGVELKDVDFTSDYWYDSFEWTVEDSIEFVDWLADKLYTDNNMREELTTLKSVEEGLTKEECIQAASSLNLMIGWKFKETDQSNQVDETNQTEQNNQ